MLTAKEALDLTIEYLESPQRKQEMLERVYKSIKEAAMRGKYKIIIGPVEHVYQHAELLNRLGYDVKSEDGLYVHISWADVKQNNSGVTHADS